MLPIILSKSALLFYLFVILTEFITKYGIKETEEKGVSFILPLADILGICIIIFLVFYSINTVWWAAVPLLLMYVAIYWLLKNIVSLPFVKGKYIHIISSQGKILLLPVLILMFILVNK